MDKYNTTKSKIEDAFYIPRDSNAYGINILLGKIVKGSGIKLMEDSSTIFSFIKYVAWIVAPVMAVIYWIKDHVKL